MGYSLAWGCFKELEQLGDPEEPQPGRQLVNVAFQETLDVGAVLDGFGLEQTQDEWNDQTGFVLVEGHSAQVSFKSILN